jgi:hypothetical protein
MKNTRIVTVALMLALGLAAAPIVLAGSGSKSEGAAEETVHEGILVDTKCYAQDPANYVNDHEAPAGKMIQCGTACAAMGIPVGLLEGGKPGGTVHVLLAPSKTLAEHVGKWARVTGSSPMAGTLLVKRLEVRGEDGTFKKVAIVTMM